MDMDYFEEFVEDKKHKDGKRENHRWTEEEVIKMLQCIAKMVKDPETEYERPSAKVFYEEMKCKYYQDCNLTSNVIKSKMRHLKASYLKAIKWKDTVGLQLYDSDQKHVQSRIKSICPYYNLLDEIFGPISNSDPIGFRLPDEETLLSECISKPVKRARAENSVPLVVLKTESLNDEQEDIGEETHDTINDDDDDYEETYNETRRGNINFSNYDNKLNALKAKLNNAKSTNKSLEERTYQLEKQKFQINFTLQSRRISLEEKRFQFEREKFEKTQKMRKYEIDKQFEIKKLEIESNERLKRLELCKSAESVVAEVENMPSFEHNTTEEEVCSEFVE